MKVKLFSKKESKQLNLKNEINEWFEENPSIKVIEIKQSVSGETLSSLKWFISVWYQEVT